VANATLIGGVGAGCIGVAMRKDKNFGGIKWALLLAALCLLAVLGFYLSALPEPELNKLLVKWLSIFLLVLFISAVLAISVLWNKANGEARYREGSQAALRSRIFPSPTPYRGYAPPVQQYGDWPAPPPPEQGPVLKMLPDVLFSDMGDKPS